MTTSNTFGGWYPCCCPTDGSTRPGSSVPPLGSSLAGSSVAIDLNQFGQIGSSGLVECACCLGGVAPLQMQVEAVGVIPGDDFPCADCEDLNGAYILTWLSPAEYGDYCLPEDFDCAWGLVFETICGRNKAQLFLRCDPAPPNVFVAFGIEPADCLDTINGGLVWTRQFNGVSQIGCNFDGLELSAPSGAPALSCKLDVGTGATVFGL